MSTIEQKLTEHFAHDEAFEESILLRLAALEEEVRKRKDFKRQLMINSGAVLIAVLAAFGTVQYSRGSQDARVEQNAQNIEQIKQDVKDVQQKATDNGEGIARVDERTKLILDELRRLRENIR